MTTLTKVIAVAFCAAVALVAMLVLALRRAAQSFKPSGMPTPKEAEVHVKAEAERAKIEGTTPSGAAVREMTDAEAEALANDREPLVPGRK